jgi:hypothetical protein
LRRPGRRRAPACPRTQHPPAHRGRYLGARPR